MRPIREIRDGRDAGRASDPEPEETSEAPACPVCAGFGFLQARDGRRLVPCACREGSIVEARRRAARIPERYRNCTLANYNVLPAKDVGPEAHASQQAARALARRFVESWPAVSAGLLLMGPVGVGKTHLAVAILKDVVEKGARGLFCDFSDLLDRIQATFSRDNDDSAEEILAPYRDAELLVLDELGARRPSDWVREVLYGLLNARYNRRLVTILTTNYVDVAEKSGGETLEVRVGVPIRSRLAEMCQLVAMTGKDYRREVKPGRAFA